MQKTKKSIQGLPLPKRSRITTNIYSQFTGTITNITIRQAQGAING